MKINKLKEVGGLAFLYWSGNGNPCTILKKCPLNPYHLIGQCSFGRRLSLELVFDVTTALAGACFGLEVKTFANGIASFERA